MMKIRTRIVGGLALVLAFGIVGLLWKPSLPPSSSLSIATALPTPQPLPEFSLFDTDGKRMSNERLRGRWSFVYFGYSYCPDICPAALSLLSKVTESIPEQMAQFIFISADPARDTPERLAHYLHAFSPRFTGVLGQHEQVTSLARSLHVFLSNTNDPTQTDIDHGNTVLLINPNGELAAIFNGPSEPVLMVEDFRRLARS